MENIEQRRNTTTNKQPNKHHNKHHNKQAINQPTNQPTTNHLRCKVRSQKICWTKCRSSTCALGTRSGGPSSTKPRFFCFFFCGGGFFRLKTSGKPIDFRRFFGDMSPFITGRSPPCMKSPWTPELWIDKQQTKAYWRLLDVFFASCFFGIKCLVDCIVGIFLRLLFQPKKCSPLAILTPHWNTIPSQHDIPPSQQMTTWHPKPDIQKGFLQGRPLPVLIGVMGPLKVPRWNNPG